MINRKIVLKKYNDWVNQVSEDLEDKTYFSIEEIVNKVCEIVEEEEKDTYGNDISKSVISELSKQQQFYISLISNLNNELIEKKIITPMQKNQISKYMLEMMNNKRSSL